MKKSHHAHFLSLILAFILSFSLCAPAFAAGTFSDVPETHWAYGDIMECANLGIVTGFADGTFRPNDTVTQVEFVVMFSRVVDAQEGVENAAAELGGNAPWYLPTMTWASNNETLYSTSFADPNTWAAATVTPITRADMAVIAYDACFYGDNNAARWDVPLAALADEDQIAEKYRLFIGGCMTVNCLTGYPDGTFRPDAVMTRAEACVVAGRMRRLWTGEGLTQPAAPGQTQQPESPAGTGKLANGKDATVDNVLEILDQLEQEYPDETVWGPQGTANNHSYSAGNSSTDVRAVTNMFTAYNPGQGTGRLDTVYGCGGFAAMVSDRIFGQTGAPAREVTDPSKVRPGDIVINFNSNGQVTHVAIASESAHTISTLSGAVKYGFTCCEGNNGGYVNWGTGYANLYPSSNGSYCRAWTRYPEALS